jgi:predicted CoA-substrate-specific enzyme activase
MKMITAGIDVGTETTKVIILSDNEIVSWRVLVGGEEGAITLAKRALDEAAAKAGVNSTDIQKLIATGLGGINIPFVNDRESEAMCTARGADWLLPSTRIALDLGAGKSVAVKCYNGRATKVARNDSCASGTGKYLEIVANVLRMGIQEMADLSLRAREYVEVQSTCAVFAESEIISLLHMKKRPEDIVRGALRGLVKRIYPLLLEVGLEKDVTVVGGVARNKGLIRALEELMGFSVFVPPEPQIVAALGAALIAQGGVTS